MFNFRPQPPEASMTPQGGPPSYSRNQTDSLPPMASVGSPGSAAPSPLPNPSSQQPQSVGNCGGEQIMPTLSPQHIPPGSNSNVNAGTPSSAGPLPMVHTPTPPASIEPPTRPSTSQVSPTINTSTPNSQSQTCGNLTSIPKTTPTITPTVAFKRPILSSRDYETAILEDDQPLDLLYDYTTLEAWLHHPVKRFKGDASHSWRNKNGDLYANETHSTTGSIVSQEQASDPTICESVFIKQEIKLEPNLDCMVS